MGISIPVKTKFSFEKEQVEVNPFYNEKDTTLAKANLVRLGFEFVASYAPNIFRLKDTLTLASRFMSVSQVMTALETAPPINSVEGFLRHPLIPLVNLFTTALTGSSLLGKVHILANLWGVAGHSGTNLAVSLANVVKKPFAALSAAFLHGFNLVSQGYFSHRDFEILDEETKAMFRPSEEESRATEPLERYYKMSDIDRLNADLNPKSPKDASIAMNDVSVAAGVGLKMSGGFKEGELAATCSKLKKAYRNLATNIHPDKVKTEKATSAFAKLSDFKATLHKYFECPGKP